MAHVIYELDGKLCQCSSIRGVPSGISWREVTEADLLSIVKERRKKYINSKRNEALSFGVEYNGNTYDSDPTSQGNLTKIHTGVNDGYVLPTGFTWRTSDNQDIPFSVSDVNNLAHIMLDHGNYVYNNSWTKKKDIDDATTVDEVNSVDW